MNNCLRITCQLDGAHCDSVGLNVVRVTISTVWVVGDNHVWANFADDRCELGTCLIEVCLPESIRALTARCAHAAGVTVASLATEIAMVVEPKRGNRVAQLGRTVIAQSILPIGGQMCKFGDDDFALLSPRARHNRHMRSLCDIFGDRAPGRTRLVVGMCVGQKESTLLNHALFTAIFIDFR
jgi:hypothetical protein